MKKKFSEFNIIAETTGSDYLAGFRDSGNPEVLNTNFAIKVEDIQNAFTESNKVKPYGSSSVTGFLYDLITLSSGLKKQEFNDTVKLTLKQEELDLSLMDNSTSNFISGNVYYDSGWITVKSYEDPALPGLFTATNTPNPLRFRVINKTCFLQGNVYIPLYNNETQEVVLNHNFIPTIKDTEVARGVNTGVEYFHSVSGRGLSFPRFLPHGLNLETTYNSGIKFSGRRDVGFLDNENQFIINSGTPVGKRATFPVSDIQINTNGSMVIKSLFDLNSINISNYFMTPTVGTELNSLARVSSSFKEGDSPLDFTNYKNSFNESLTEERDYTKKYIDQIYETLKYPFDFKGDNAVYWGGAFIYLNEVVTLDTSLSLNDIKNLIENY